MKAPRGAQRHVLAAAVIRAIPISPSALFLSARLVRARLMSPHGNVWAHFYALPPPPRCCCSQTPTILYTSVLYPLSVERHRGRLTNRSYTATAAAAVLYM